MPARRSTWVSLPLILSGISLVRWQLIRTFWNYPSIGPERSAQLRNRRIAILLILAVGIERFNARPLGRTSKLFLPPKKRNQLGS